MPYSAILWCSRFASHIDFPISSCPAAPDGVWTSRDMSEPKTHCRLAPPMKVSYFLHDVGHPDLARRVGMLREGGAETIVFGFHRIRPADADVAASVIDLGQTVDARLAQRVWAVARALRRLRRWASELASSNVILARNLEMLFLAAVARRLYAPRAALVYECLDIHRLMLTNGVVGRALRQLERRLLKRCQGLIVSSPAFIREYFQRFHPALPKLFVVENKVFLSGEVPSKRKTEVPAGPPWRIGWFGLLRCRRSLEILLDVLRSVPGSVEVIVAGRLTPDVFGDIENDLQHIPGLTFLGPYRDDATDLSRLFGSVHVAWAIDFYEAGANSAWLLPNRLYRAALYGAVPVAMANIETGRWLAAHGAGILLEEPARDSLVAMIRGMTLEKLAGAQAMLERIPRSALVIEPEECRALVRALGELGRGPCGP